MNTDHLRYLLTIADCRSINKASEQLLLKQQYLSTLVKSLEKQFGIRIFDRNYRGVTLTPDGEYLTNQLRTILPMLDQLQMPHLYPSNQQYRYDELDLHLYSIAQVSSRSLSKCLQEFRLAFPKVTLTYTEKHPSKIISLVKDDPFSLGIISPLESEDVVRRILPPNISLFFLRATKMVALASINNPVAQQLRTISCEELIKQELLIYTDSTIENSQVYKALSPYGKLNTKNVIQNSSLYFDILRSSNYFSLGEHTIAQRENLLAIPLEEDLHMHAMLIVNDQALQSLAVKTLINMFMIHNGHPVIVFDK